MPTQIDRTRRGWPWQIGADGEVLKVVDGWPTWDAEAGGGGGGGSIGTKWRGYIYPQPNSSTVSAFGFAAPIAAGFTSGGIISSASLWQSLPRVTYNDGPASSAAAGIRDANGQFLSASAGYKIRFRAGPGTGGNVSSHRFFIGLRDTFSSPTDANPSTYTDIIGLGYDAADTQVQIMHNDGSGTATKVALGASFPKPSVASTNVFDLTLECEPGASSVSYSVIDVSSGSVAAGTISTNLPAASTLLDWWSQMSAGGTVTAVEFGFFGVDVEIGAQ